MKIENPVIGIFLVIMIYMGLGVLYGKLMRFMGGFIHSLIQRIRSSLK